MLIVGCGYLGKHLLDLPQVDPAQTPAWVHSAASVGTLRARGVAATAVDLDRPLADDLPAPPARVLYLAPPPPQGCADPRMAHFIAWLERHAAAPRVLYVSTTGVYGDCGGDWVDERRPANPGVDRARRRWDAEQQLRAWRERSGGELVILRVAGIYGPGRLPLERLRRRVPMIAAQDAPWTNRIHVDDLARACVLAMQRCRDGEVYNASDGQPGNMADYFNRVADLAGLQRPPLIGLDEARRTLSAGMLSYLAESRRLSNAKLLAATGMDLRYPTLELGLSASID